MEKQPRRPCFPHAQLPGVWCVPLSKGKAALIDAIDLPLIGAHNWHAIDRADRPNGAIYARRRENVDGVRIPIWMHRAILGVGPEAIVDHANGNGLDNRRQNLREAEYSQNAHNWQRPRGKHGFRGVTVPNSETRFRAQIRADGRLITIGWADTAEGAARLYDAAARQYYGAFAVVNFPEDGERAA